MKLTVDKDMAYLSKQLGTIRTDAPVDTNVSHYVRQPADYRRARQMLNRLEMYTLSEKLCGTRQRRPEQEDLPEIKVRFKLLELFSFTNRV